MSRLYFKEDWFLPLSPTAIPESQFEDILIENSDVFRPNSWMVRFKKTIYSADSSARPDLAIIDRDYRLWFVVEVEMERHSLYDHVLPQVRTLRDGHYRQEEAEYLIERLPQAEPRKIVDLVKGKSPRVVVIGDRQVDSWRESLRGADVEFMSLELYKSELNEYIFSTNGELPSQPAELVTYCSYTQMLPRQLKVESPASLGISSHDELAVLWEGRTVEWVRMDSANACYLRTRGAILLRERARYALVRLNTGQLELRIVPISEG